MGRYQIVAAIGTGARRSVYRAHDPRLERDVKLEVLHRPRPDGKDREIWVRLLRDRQTLAQLSHPNVAAVYDVGVQDDAVFVAMERVEGEPLHRWLSAKRRRTEVLRVLCAAGRGLAAAHAAGIIRSELEPADILVVSDGRSAVVDFGLAPRSAGDLDDERRALPHESGMLVREPGAEGQTRGEGPAAESTPPESGLDGVVAQSEAAEDDQYVFAETAFVALTGSKWVPLADDTRPPSSGDARPVWPPAVPMRIRRVIERGLAPRPADRFPSAHALVEALNGMVSPRRTLAWAALVLGVLALCGVAWGAKTTLGRPTCHSDAGAFDGVWDPAHRAGLEQALLASGSPNASEASGRLATRLDAFRDAWLEMKQDACRATHVRGEQSERQLALRNACLGRKLHGLGALVAAFTVPEEAAVDRAAGAMPDRLDDCADVARLEGDVERLPAEPAARAEALSIEFGFARTRALIAAGRDATRGAREQLVAARVAGHARTTAEAASWLARALLATTGTREERQEAEALLREAMHLAATSGDDRLLATTASYLFAIIAYVQRRIQEADAMLPMVEAIVSRAGNDPERRIELSMGRAMILWRRGQYDDAVAAFGDVIALAPLAQSELREYGADAEGKTGEIYLGRHDYPKALQRFEAELWDVERELGERHPRAIVSLTNLGLAQARAGLVSAAWVTARRLRELLDRSFPADDWRQVSVLYLEANIWENDGQCERALPLYRDALGRVTAMYGPEGTNTADVRERLGHCLALSGQATEARTELERALGIRSRLGEAPNAIADAAFELASLLWSRGAPADRARATALAERARGLWQHDGIPAAAARAEAWLAERRKPSAAR